ncbi:alkaline metalloproteinase precursor [Xenorhabdus mauleonii]|uniref:Alkaline metalloproteinase n=1 Tax=Xenorhabdus mauleonii TaxID=351675 RepID=A0A1I3VXF0_9GAMM|nr:M10 family metallopeptidase [Xenorhabdus mauleonii]PHM36929.1 alkaline metalloproteinase precursor [Xenorhabdus mauleonii]SFJ99643.1 serralysin [Xenorhabdus mauleonii]
MSLLKNHYFSNESSDSDAVKRLKKYLYYYDLNEHPEINKFEKPIFGDKAFKELLRRKFYWKDKQYEDPFKIDIEFRYFLLTSNSKFINGPLVKEAMKKARVAELATIDMNIKNALDKSYEAWSKVTNIYFTEVFDYNKADLVVGFYSKNIGKTDLNPFTRSPNEKNYKFHSWFNVNNRKFLDPKCLEVNRNIRKAFIHEIGHQLCLSHPSKYDASDKEKPTYEKKASHFEDSFAYSVMSYFNESYTGQDFKGFLPSCPMMDDIAAVQALYGVKKKPDDIKIIYGFNSNTNLDYTTAINEDSKLLFCACSPIGENVINIFDFSGFKQDQVINLNEAAFSDIGGLQGNVSISRGCIISAAIGGEGNDIIIGNNTGNRLDGIAGDNIFYSGFGGYNALYPGTGKNTFVYLSGNQSVKDAYDIIFHFKTGKDKVDLSGFYFGDKKRKVRFVSRDVFEQPGDAYLKFESISNSITLIIKLGEGMRSDEFNLVFLYSKEVTEADFIL